MTSNKQKAAIIGLIGIFILPVVLLGVEDLQTSPPNVEKTVWASLYTWYGVPGQPAGKYGYDEWQKNSSDPEDIGWEKTLSTMASVIENADPNGFNVSGTAASAGQSLILGIEYAHLHPYRMYVELNMSISNIDNANLETYIYQWPDKVSKTNITEQIDSDITYSIINTVHYIKLNMTSSSYYPGNLMLVNLTAINPGDFSISVNYMEGSAWKHYNEDYHTYPDESGYYYNDPPVHLATANRVYYDGVKWPNIPSYGAYNHSKWNEFDSDDELYYGIYDSMNTTVIKAQLMLMEKAGIDVCQLMHPWSIEVAELILNVAEQIDSNLTFSYYTGRTINQLSEIMERISDDSRYYKIDGRPVVTWGYTGGLNEPFTVTYQRAIAAREAWDVYFVGDLYSSRFITKEEMLQIYDCWYYYDTSAFLRHGYTLPQIPNYQMDGTLYPLNNWGHLDKLFGSLSAISHGHGKAYCAIVIPGTDNTPVHGFTGTEMYDGRTGTINGRANGLTFNYTWQAAIDANSDFVDIVSWNELHEGTEIEPTFENGTTYVELNKIWADKFRDQ